MSCELKDLVGLRTLDAVDFEDMRIPDEYDDERMVDSNVCRFRLDGIIYMAVEDQSDGYRSSMREVQKTRRSKVVNAFPPIKVLCRHKDKSDDDYYENDILEIIDVVTAKVVLEVGTSHTDDYYPSFVASFHPENMVTNAPSISKGSVK